MATSELDVLVLGRQANVAFASGANQLWTAGARPFAPTCVVVAPTGRVHLLSTWEEGVPEEIAHEDLYGLTWNPANLVASLAAIPGLAVAHRVGTDALGPGFTQLVDALAPGSAIVDATATVRAARGPKSPDEIECIVQATKLAERALAAMKGALRPGITERQLLAVYVECIAALGAPTPPTEAVACVTGRNPVQLRRVPTDRAVEVGDVVVLDVDARYRGYEGGAGRTIAVGTGSQPAQRDLARRCIVGLDAVVAACRPGTTGEELRAAWLATGSPLPPCPLAYGVGMGMEPPVIGDGVGDREVLTDRTVLAVTSWVAEEGVGGWLHRDLVLVGAEPVALSPSMSGGMTRG